MGLTPLQFQRQTDTAEFRDRFAKYKYLTNSYSYLGYNLKRPLFRDVRVRRAISHAINKQEIVDAVLLGLGSPAAVPYKPGTYWFNDRVKGPEYDPEKAKRLLAEAGWTDSDGDGVLDRQGERFQFEIITNKGNEQREKAATVIQRRLDEIGIKVTIKVIEWAAFINNFIDKRNFDAVILGWSLSPDPDQYDIWHSSKTRPKEFNFVSYANAEVDEVLEKGRRTFDRAERKKHYDRLQEVLDQEQPYTFLYVADALPIVHKRFHGIEPAPAGISYNFNEWYVPASMQKYRIADVP
jgi:peptide/nickel transport system substrate-binding protein